MGSVEKPFIGAIEAPKARSQSNKGAVKMRITATMKVKEVLGLKPALIDAFAWLAPEFERFRVPALRRVVAERITVEQAAWTAKVPLGEMLYVLNLAAGVGSAHLQRELNPMLIAAFTYLSDEPPQRPIEISDIRDDESRVRFLDLIESARRQEDPLPVIIRELAKLKNDREIVLLRHPFDPVPLRILFARRGYVSWAEERRAQEWFIYFYRAGARSSAVAYPPLTVAQSTRAAGVGV
jgi:hypothetical protein